MNGGRKRVEGGTTARERAMRMMRMMRMMKKRSLLEHTHRRRRRIECPLIGAGRRGKNMAELQGSL